MTIKNKDKTRWQIITCGISPIATYHPDYCIRIFRIHKKRQLDKAKRTYKAKRSNIDYINVKDTLGVYFGYLDTKRTNPYIRFLLQPRPRVITPKTPVTPVTSITYCCDKDKYLHILDLINRNRNGD